MRSLLLVGFTFAGAVTWAASGCGSDDETSSLSTSTSDSSSSASNSSSTSGTGGHPSNDVIGTLSDTYVTESSDVSKVPDMASVSALLPKSGGVFDTIPGTIKADGSFTIPNVPMGVFYLQFASPG